MLSIVILKWVKEELNTKAKLKVGFNIAVNVKQDNMAGKMMEQKEYCFETHASIPKKRKKFY